MVSGIFLLTCALLVGSAFALQSLSGNEQVRKELHDMKEVSSGHNAAASKGNEDLERAVAALEDKLRTMDSLLLDIRAEQETTKRELQITKKELQREQQTTKRQLQTKQQTTNRDLLTTKRELQTTKRELQTTKRELQTSKKERQTGQASEGSTFVHWGRSTCSSHNTLVYSGFIAGKNHKIQGAGTNPLCLTKTPQFNSLPQWNSSIIVGGHFWNILKRRWDNFLTCVVCWVPLSTSIMVPGTRTCPLGWTTQYMGILVAAYDSFHATEYTCIDKNPESDSTHIYYHDAFYFYYVGVVCGNLRCPPYSQNKVVLCVVCSK